MIIQRILPPKMDRKGVWYTIFPDKKSTGVEYLQAENHIKLIEHLRTERDVSVFEELNIARNNSILKQARLESYEYSLNELLNKISNPQVRANYGVKDVGEEYHVQTNKAVLGGLNDLIGMSMTDYKLLGFKDKVKYFLKPEKRRQIAITMGNYLTNLVFTVLNATPLMGLNFWYDLEKYQTPLAKTIYPTRLIGNGMGLGLAHYQLTKLNNEYKLLKSLKQELFKPLKSSEVNHIEQPLEELLLSGGVFDKELIGERNGLSERRRILSPLFMGGHVAGTGIYSYGLVTANDPLSGLMSMSSLIAQLLMINFHNKNRKEYKSFKITELTELPKLYEFNRKRDKLFSKISMYVNAFDELIMLNTMITNPETISDSGMISNLLFTTISMTGHYILYKSSKRSKESINELHKVRFI